jgi:Ca2+-binding EF-hand superfamily protein
MILLNKMDMKSFDDNAFQAYTYIEKDHGGAGVKGFDFLKLVKMLAVEYPPEVVHGLLRQLYKREDEPVEFEEFLSGVKTVLLYDNYFEEMEVLFKHLDVTKKGTISKEDLLEAVRKLKNEEIAP